MKNIYIFFALLGIAAFSACTNPFSGGGNGEGMITIAFDSAPVPAAFAARAVVQPEEIPSMTHEITLTGSGGRTITRTIEGSGPAAISVPPGNWRVSVRAIGPRPDALDDLPNPDIFPARMVRAVGETSVEVIAGQSSPARIGMTSVIGIDSYPQLQAADEAYWGVSLRLVTDIDMPAGWTPINLAMVLDGGGHAISGLRDSLFGTIDGGTVRNLRLVNVDIDITSVGPPVPPVGALARVNARGSTVENVSVSGSVSGVSEVGGILGRNYDTVRNVSVSGTVTGTQNTVGGVVGRNMITGDLPGIIENSTVTATVRGPTTIGGIAGGNQGTVRTSSAAGLVDATGAGISDAGGVVGNNSDTGTVENSFATASVIGAGPSVGGVVGNNLGTVRNSFATGDVSGGNNVGGIVGQNAASGTTIENSVALNQTVTVTATGNVGRIAGNTPGTSNNNYARDTMSLVPSRPVYSQPTGNDGEDVSATQWHSATWWRDTANFDPAIWNLANGRLPTLRNMP